MTVWRRDPFSPHIVHAVAVAQARIRVTCQPPPRRYTDTVCDRWALVDQPGDGLTQRCPECVQRLAAAQRPT